MAPANCYIVNTSSHLLDHGKVGKPPQFIVNMFKLFKCFALSLTYKSLFFLYCLTKTYNGFLDCVPTPRCYCLKLSDRSRLEFLWGEGESSEPLLVREALERAAANENAILH